MHRLQTNITVHTMKHKIKITNGEIKYKVSVHNADRLVFRALMVASDHDHYCVICATCGRCWRQSACRYDCLCSSTYFGADNKCLEQSLANGTIV